MVHCMTRMILYFLFGMIFHSQLIDATSLSTNVRFPRSMTGISETLFEIYPNSSLSLIAVDVSLKTPTIGTLTEDAQVVASWEKCMVVAPISIQLLGQLLLVSTTKDVSFKEFSPNTKFTYIKHPESLRATLLQVSQGLS